MFPEEYVVTGLKIYRANGKEKLIVVSKEKVISVPLHQCEHQDSCRYDSTSKNPLLWYAVHDITLR